MTQLYFFLLILFGFASCTVPPEQSVSTTISTAADNTYTWKKLLDSAEWKKNYNFQLFSFRDTLRIFHPDLFDGPEIWEDSWIPGVSVQY